MWLVVTVGSPCALNIASGQSRMRRRVSRAMAGSLFPVDGKFCFASSTSRGRRGGGGFVPCRAMRGRGETHPRPNPPLEGEGFGVSAAQLGDQVDVFLLRFVLAGALELGPGLVLGGADEVEEARLVALDVAVGALLVQRVQAQQGVVVGPLGQSLDVLLCLFEACLQIGHDDLPEDARMTARGRGRVNLRLPPCSGRGRGRRVQLLACQRWQDGPAIVPAPSLWQFSRQWPHRAARSSRAWT